MNRLYFCAVHRKVYVMHLSVPTLRLLRTPEAFKRELDSVWSLTSPIATIGRGLHNDVYEFPELTNSLLSLLGANFVSRSHCQIVKLSTGTSLLVESGVNLVRVNGIILKDGELCPLADGDEIQIGNGKDDYYVLQYFAERDILPIATRHKKRTVYVSFLFEF